MSVETYKIPASMKRGENRKRCPNGFRWDKKQELCIGKTTVNVVKDLEDIHIKQDKNTMSLESLDKNNGIMKFYNKGVLIEQRRIDSNMIKKIKLKKKNFLKKIISISKKINKNPNIINADKQIQKNIKKMFKKNNTRKSGGKDKSSETVKEPQEIVGTDIIMQESMIDQLDDKELNEHISKLADLVQSNEYKEKSKENNEAFANIYEFVNSLYLFILIPYEWYASWTQATNEFIPCDGGQLLWSQPGSNSVIPVTPYNYETIYQEASEMLSAGGVTPAVESSFDQLMNGDINPWTLMSLQPVLNVLGSNILCQSNTNPNEITPFNSTDVSTTLSSTVSSFYMFDIFGAITVGIFSLLNMFIDNYVLKTSTSFAQYTYYLISIIGFVFFNAGTWVNIVIIAVRIIFKLSPVVREWRRDKDIQTNEKDINIEKEKIEQILNKKDNETTETVTDDNNSQFEAIDNTLETIDSTLDFIFSI